MGITIQPKGTPTSVKPEPMTEKENAVSKKAITENREKGISGKGIVDTRGRLFTWAEIKKLKKEEEERRKQLGKEMAEIKVTQRKERIAREKAYNEAAEERYKETGVYSYTSVPYIKSLYVRIANQYIGKTVTTRSRKMSIGYRDTKIGYLTDMPFTRLQPLGPGLSKFTVMVNVYNRFADELGYDQITPEEVGLK